MRELFNKKEVRVLIISILILGFVFGLNDNQTKFVLDSWILNLIKVLIVVSISLLFRELIRKWVAHKHGCETELNIWTFQRWGFSEGVKLPLKFLGIKLLDKIWGGILFPILVSLLSLGRFYFPVVNTTEVIEDYNKRAGKDFIRLTGSENAVINLSAAFASLFLALIGVLLRFDQFITVNFWLCLFSFLPLGNLDGTKTLFGSIYWYIFGLTFSVLAFVLINFVTLWDSIFISLIGSGLVLLYLLYVIFK